MSEELRMAVQEIRFREKGPFSFLYPHLRSCDSCKMKLLKDRDKDVLLLALMYHEGLFRKVLCTEARAILMSGIRAELR